MKTTLNAIRACSPCPDGWKKLLQHLGKTEADDEPLSIVMVLDSNGLDDSFWCLRAVTGQDREIRLFAVWCARRAQHLNTDPRVEAALVAAEGFANGAVSAFDMAEAEAAAWATAERKPRVWADTATRVWAQAAAQAAAWAPAWVASASEAAAEAANAIAAEAAARSVAGVWGASPTEVWAVELDAQAVELRRLCAEIDAGGVK